MNAGLRGFSTLNRLSSSRRNRPWALPPDRAILCGWSALRKYSRASLTPSVLTKSITRISLLPNGSTSSSTSSSSTGVLSAQLQTDLSEFIELLNSRKVEYLVVGGHAVAFHGHPRFTGDIDFFINASPENAQRVLDVLASFGFGDLGIALTDLTAPDRVVQLGRPPNRIDILTTISGVTFGEAWSSR